MTSTRDQLGEEKIDIKALLKMLVESQAKQAEFQARQAELQAETQAKQAESQQQIIEILNSNSNAIKDHNREDKDTSNGADKIEMSDAAAVKLDEDIQVAVFIKGKHDRLREAFEENAMETVKEILKDNPKVVEEGIAHDSSTALHLAIFCRRDIKIVQKIIELMQPKTLECKTRDNGYTSCHFAAIYGYPEAAELMVNKNPKLTQIRDVHGRTPLELAFDFVTTGQKEVVKYLYSVTRDENQSPFSGQDGVRLLQRAIDSNFFDLALCLVRRYPQLIMEKLLKTDMCALELLVRKPLAFKSGGELTWLQERIYPRIQVDTKSIYVHPANSDVSSTAKKGTLMAYLTRAPYIEKLHDLKLMHKQALALLKQMLLEICKTANDDSEIVTFFENNSKIIKVAIRHGLIEVIVQGLEHFGHLMRYRLPDRMMIEIAIAERNEKIVNLICDRSEKNGDKVDLVSAIDKDRNTLLHYAAKSAPSSKLNMISGVALQMQREVQWFKGVESIMRETDRYKRNINGDTAQYLFAEEHKDLLKKAEDWMKDTSGSCMIVAALVATVAFAAVFTVPGGNINESGSSMNGTPIFLGKPSFTMFVVADAIALFASITSVLMFLAIYTSRYSAMDFLKSLPQKVIIGFAALFISMAAILIAFGASIFIVVGGRFPRAPIPIAVVTSCPILLFVWLQLPLFWKMVRSTYWGSILHRHKYIPAAFGKNQKRKYTIVTREPKNDQVSLAMQD